MTKGIRGWFSGGEEPALQEDEFAVYEQYYSIAVDYCALVEAAASCEREEWLKRIRRKLPSLLHQAIHLPQVSVSRVETLPGIEHDRWESVCKQLGAVLGDEQFHVVNPSEQQSGYVSFPADDLADIWRDNAEGIEAWRTGEPEQQLEAAWHWKFSFETHWSYHLVDAIRWIEQCRSSVMSN